MIVSKGKLWDLKVRALLLDAMEILVKTGRMAVAREVGQVSAKLAERINTYDYKKEDEEWATVLELDRETNKIYGSPRH